MSHGPGPKVHHPNIEQLRLPPHSQLEEHCEAPLRLKASFIPFVQRGSSQVKGVGLGHSGSSGSSGSSTVGTSNATSGRIPMQFSSFRLPRSSRGHSQFASFSTPNSSTRQVVGSDKAAAMIPMRMISHQKPQQLPSMMQPTLSQWPQQYLPLG